MPTPRAILALLTSDELLDNLDYYVHDGRVQPEPRGLGAAQTGTPQEART